MYSSKYWLFVIFNYSSNTSFSKYNFKEIAQFYKQNFPVITICGQKAYFNLKIAICIGINKKQLFQLEEKYYFIFLITAQLSLRQRINWVELSMFMIVSL